MRQRISVEHIEEPLSAEVRQSYLDGIELEINQLSQLDPIWLAFCQEKLGLANESLNFILNQWLRLHQRGFPSHELDYLRLIERQNRALKDVYVAMFRLAPGLIYQLKNSEPQIFVWLMLQPEFGQSQQHRVVGLENLSQLTPIQANILVVQSSLDALDRDLVSLIEGEAPYAEPCFQWLKLRQTLSTSLCKRWLKFERIDERALNTTLAQLNDRDAIEWLDEHASGEQMLYERLLVKQDRNTWFRQYFGIEPAALPSAMVATYAKLLELKEFEWFDIQSEHAAYHYALVGDTQWTKSVIEHLATVDESDGETWLQALYVVYGERLPLNHLQLGIDYQWEEAVANLQTWLETGDEQLSLPSRLGFAFGFESSLRAMSDSAISADFRDWIWRQICLGARVYVPWDMSMPTRQQQQILDKLKQNKPAMDRFNLRNDHAVMGY
ncbi:hypothetical protein [Vibrio olivae]|uniref:TIGR02270 family protein n=1 Tax=Vibrio olivae TaxID=1243002 RepID=A0ABV5HIQ3_9VIBR